MTLKPLKNYPACLFIKNKQIKKKPVQFRFSTLIKVVEPDCRCFRGNNCSLTLENKKLQTFLLTTEHSPCHVRLTLHMFWSEKPHGQTGSNTTCQPPSTCSEIFQTLSEARASEALSHSNSPGETKTFQTPVYCIYQVIASSSPPLFWHALQ